MTVAFFSSHGGQRANKKTTLPDRWHQSCNTHITGTNSGTSSGGNDQEVAMREQSEEHSKNQREFCRVDAYLPFSFRILTPEEGHVLQCRGITTSASPYSSRSLQEIDDPALGEWIKFINAKLDSILYLLTLNQEGFSSLPLKPVNISGSGMSFISPEPIPPGTRVEVQLVLTSGLALPLYLIGEVVSGEQKGDGYRIGMRFVNIDEAIRKEIIRFVFTREREIMRDMRGM